MDWVQIGLALFGGVGVGSVATTLIKEGYEKKRFVFKEKMTVYAHFLEAYQNCVIANSSENARQKVAYAHKCLELIAPKEISSLCQKFYDSPRGDGIKVRDALVKAMRKDLKI